MKKALLLIYLCCQSILLSAQNIELTGFIRDANTLEALPGANVVIKEKAMGTITQVDGSFTLELRDPEISLIFSFIGYETLEQRYVFSQDSTLQIFLKPLSILQGQVDVVADLTQPESGRLKLKSKEIDVLPRFLGEADAIKALQMSAGVQTATEGDAGIYVRGGGPGQNLILLDDMPIHSANHLLGIQSVFNPNTISSIELHKGGMPAEYGGRLSSLIDVRSNLRLDTSLHANLSLGSLTSGAALKVPIGKKATLLLGGRYSQLSVYKAIAELANLSNSFYRKTDYSMYDINGAFTIKPGTKHSVTLSALHTGDHYDYDQPEQAFNNSIDWGNKAYGLKWNYNVTTDYTIKQNVGYSHYKSDMKAKFQEYGVQLYSEINDYYYKQNHLFNIGDVFVKSGLEYHKYEVVPDRLDITSTDNAVSFQSELHGHEASLYVQAEWNIKPKWTLNTGLRLNWYVHTGPYAEPIRNEFGQINDTIQYGKGDLLQQYLTLDPRIMASYQLDEMQSLKASYTYTSQNLHLATVSSVSMPTDIWLPSTVNVRPQRAHQISAGYYYRIPSWSFSAELYYKRMNNLIEFKGGLFAKSNELAVDQNMEQGKGNAYGMELYAQKRMGRITGWASYTLARSDRQFEGLNNGKVFPAKYDRRHDLSVIANYKLNPQLSFSAAFILTSGSRMTIAEGRYIIEGKVANAYGDLNGYGMPAYHRLDLSANMLLVDKSKWKSHLNLSIYNVYSRMNTYYIYFGISGDLDNYELNVQAQQVSLFPILPSLSWSIEF